MQCGKILCPNKYRCWYSTPIPRSIFCGKILRFTCTNVICKVSILSQYGSISTLASTFVVTLLIFVNKRFPRCTAVVIAQTVLMIISENCQLLFTLLSSSSNATHLRFCFFSCFGFLYRFCSTWVDRCDGEGCSGFMLQRQKQTR